MKFWNGTIAVAGKDLRSLFFSPLFYVIAALCSAIWSVMYLIGLQQFEANTRMMMFQQMQRGGQGEGGPNIHYEVFARHISLTNFIMILAVAALTMRLFAEEKKQRTMDLLMTSPLTATQIVGGKFLAGLLAAWALIAISFLYPASVGFVAEFDWGPLLSSYLGLLLLTAGYVAVGAFASSLTESAVLAVVMSLIFSVSIWFVGAGSEVAENAFWRSVFEHLSVGTHFVSFLKGSVGIASTVYFLSLAFLCCFLTQRVVESSRWR